MKETMATLSQALPFVHPAFAGAALALGLIPIFVHLINRRRFVRVPWAAMTFLMAANRRSAKRVWIEQWVLLLTRIALIVLFGLAVARPYLPASGSFPIRASGVHRVLLLDNSLSMNARTAAGGTRFDAAKTVADQLLAGFPAADGVSIVTLADPAQTVIGQPTHDRRLARERIGSVAATQRSADAGGAVAAALEVLKSSRFPETNRAVYLISDLPKTRWTSATTGQATGAMSALRRLADALNHPATDLNVILTAPTPHDNVAVTDLLADSALTGLNQPIRMTATVTNFAGVTVRDRTLQIRRDGQIIRREPLSPIRPGDSATAGFTTEFSTPGTHLIDAKVTSTQGDALAEDDTRYLSMEIRSAIPVLLVDGRPGRARLSGEAGYLATALAPKFAENQPILIDPKVIPEPELAAEALGDYAVIALCNVQRLSEPMWSRLTAYVSNGGGLMVFGGELVSLDNYNRFGYADGRGVLPGRVGRITDAPGGGDAFLGFKLAEPVHPLTIDFVGHPESSLFTARATKYLPIELDVGRGQVVLRFTNDAPAMVASSLGTGRTLWCGTTANMAWSSLPAKGDFVSLMMSAASFLTPPAGTHRNVLVGRPVRERLTPAETSMPLRVVTGGAATEPSIVPDGEGLALKSDPVEAAGPVTVTIGPTIRAFAANVDAAESDLTPVDASSFTLALERPVNFVGDPGAVAGEPAAARSTELASPVLYIVLALLLFEAGLAMWFGSQRAATGEGN